MKDDFRFGIRGDQLVWERGAGPIGDRLTVTKERVPLGNKIRL